MASILSRLSEASATCLDVLGPAVQARAACRRVELEAELGGDHHLVAERRERFADQLLVRERAVDLGGVEERDAALDGRADQRDHLLLVGRPGRSRSSCPCSRARGPRLPGCSCPVFASASCVSSQRARGQTPRRTSVTSTGGDVACEIDMPLSSSLHKRTRRAQPRSVAARFDAGSAHRDAPHVAGSARQPDEVAELVRLVAVRLQLARHRRSVASSWNARSSS